MLNIRVSKSQFKSHALEYFRHIQETGQEVIITDRGLPVLKIVPYWQDPDNDLQILRNTVLKYDTPLDPVMLEAWEALP